MTLEYFLASGKPCFPATALQRVAPCHQVSLTLSATEILQNKKNMHVEKPNKKKQKLGSKDRVEFWKRTLKTNQKIMTIFNYTLNLLQDADKNEQVS